jgi:hypothetical protein
MFQRSAKEVLCFRAFISAALKRMISCCGALVHCCGFGTCGWRGVGTAQIPRRPVAAAAMLAWHGSTLYMSGTMATRNGPGPTAPADQGSFFGTLPTRKPVLKDLALRHFVHDGEEGPAGWTLSPDALDHPSGNLMPRAGCAGCSLTRPGQDPQSATFHSARHSTVCRARPLNGLLGRTRIFWWAASPSGGSWLP